MQDNDPTGSDIKVFFLAQGEQNAATVVSWLVEYIQVAKKSLDFAFYDFRLSAELRLPIETALRERAAASVQIRFVYDADKPETPDLVAGQDPAEGGTGSVIQALGYPWRRIGGPKLMHHKYIVRDAGTPAGYVWTGSTNLTNNSLTLQENNIIQLASPELANYYAHNFAELWEKEAIVETGNFDTTPVALEFQGNPARVQTWFSPGRGNAIDYEIAAEIARAKRRVKICSMLLNSTAFITALEDAIREGKVEIDGIYDKTQMETVFEQWRELPRNRWKIEAVQNLVLALGLVGKNSIPYSPDTPHDFMHNKVLVIDDTVITGSYNFSHSAMQNAENLLRIECAALADFYANYIDFLKKKYRA